MEGWSGEGWSAERLYSILLEASKPIESLGCVMVSLSLSKVRRQHACVNLKVVSKKRKGSGLF